MDRNTDNLSDTLANIRTSTGNLRDLTDTLNRRPSVLIRGGPVLLEPSPIVYRTGPNEMGTYLYHRWAVAAVEMVKTKLVGLLRSLGDYRSVCGFGETSDANFVVRGRLSELAEVDGASIAGLVSMEFELYNRRTARTVWSHSYSQVEPAQGKDVSAVVGTLDRNLDRGLK